MIIKLIHKCDDGSSRTIDAETNSLEESIEDFLNTNNKIAGILEIYEKLNDGKYRKLNEIETGKSELDK